MHAGFAMTALPTSIRTVTSGCATVEISGFVESGTDALGNAAGIPFGSIARMILLYLQSEAVKTRSRDLELGRSMNHC